MGRISEKMRAKDRYGLARSLFIFLVITIFVFFILQKISFNKSLTSCQNNMENGAGMVTTQFNDMVTCNIQYASGIANALSGINLSNNEYVTKMLKSIKDSCRFDDVLILYSTGETLKMDGTASNAESNLVSLAFNNDKGVSLLHSKNGNEDIVLHVPIVEGKSELIGIIDKNDFIRNFNMFNYGDVNNVMIVSSTDGKVLLNMNGQGIVEIKHINNMFDYFAHQKFIRPYTYGDAKRDMSKEQSGFTSFKSSESNESYYIYYSPIGYEDWMLVQVLSEAVVNSTFNSYISAILIALLSLILVYVIILLFSVYLIRKSNKENDEIRMKIKVAELANEAKTSFLSNMSHDIRTPLNAIVGLADICEMNADNPDRVKDCIEKQKAASEHLMTLINDVLEMSRIESGRVVFEDNEFNIGQQLHELVIMIQQRIDEKKLNLNVSVSNLIHELVIGDAHRLNRVMINIISNAVKFTETGGDITILLNENSTDEEGYSEFEFKVKDTGRGMSPDFIRKIFVPFERMQDSTVSQIEGAGLGMAIAHDLIEKMGGTIQVESKVGEGTCVSINVKMKVISEDGEKIKYKDLLNMYEDQTIVVIDEDEHLVDWMNKMITSINLKCAPYTSARKAIDMVTEMKNNNVKIALIIIEWKMKEIDGVELSTILRDILGNDVPIVLQTVYEVDDSDNDMRKAGINHVMIEPVFRTDILGIFEEIKNGGITSKMTFPDFTGKRILLVEDHKVNAEIVKEYLEYTGISVDVVYDGTDAVERIRQTEDGYYNLILMDIRMPKMNGYDATRIIRAMPRRYTKEIPIIALSANAFVEDKRMSREVGMNGHLAKPVKYDEVYTELKKWFV